ncbi:MAG: hypothetical protein ABSB35_32945 [Bryobacteraceae bacterium]
MVVFRREGLRMAPWYLAAFLLWTFLGVLLVTFVAASLPLRSWNWGKAGFVAGVGILVFPTLAGALGLMSWIRDFRKSFIAIDQLGLRLRIPGTAETSLSWPEVTGVRYEKRWMTLGTFFKLRCRVDAYTISTAHTSLTFSAIDIPSPKRAAREIASRIGAEIVTAPVR